ncbi:MAG: amidase [Polyangiaceae bacterium]|nr:amidase [Polyangiaceae bacterium]
MRKRTKGRLSGTALRALAGVARTPVRPVLAQLLRRQLGVDALGDLPEEKKAPLPLDVVPVQAQPSHERPSADLGALASGEWPRTVRDYVHAYRTGTLSPEAVLDRALSTARRLSTCSPPRGPLLSYDTDRALAAARESAERLASGTPRSDLEGVPIAIEEDVDVEGLPTRHGSGWRPNTPAVRDAVTVERLRRAGAIVIGQTPMTEHGLSPFGANPHRSMPRNAHDAHRLAGGSSTGSAVAVASGVVPLALGSDAGGGVRIPAALNGVFGLKPTFGRVPLAGHALRAGSTVATIGPMGASSHDLACFLAATAGADARDAASNQQPRPDPAVFLASIGRGVRGLRIGIDEREWAAAPATPASLGRAALAALERDGATLVPIHVPLSSRAPAASYVTIGVETLTALREAFTLHLKELGPDLQLVLLAISELSGTEFLEAQRLRAALRLEVAAVLGAVDVLALPTTARAAPPVTDHEASRGFADPIALDALWRYSALADLTGLPAGTAPVGMDEVGLPLGLQIVGDAWDEASVLAVLAHLERSGAARVRRPSIAVDPFSPPPAGWSRAPPPP